MEYHRYGAMQMWPFNKYYGMRRMIRINVCWRESGKQKPFKGWLIFFFFFTNCEFVVVEMLYDLKMEILNGLISLTPCLGLVVATLM